jgi:hypothetical protein
MIYGLAFRMEAFEFPYRFRRSLEHAFATKVFMGEKRNSFFFLAKIIFQVESVFFYSGAPSKEKKKKEKKRERV